MLYDNGQRVKLKMAILRTMIVGDVAGLQEGENHMITQMLKWFRTENETLKLENQAPKLLNEHLDEKSKFLLTIR